MLSIIIPIFNQHDMTHECITAIRECTHGSYELIIVDNGSDPPFKTPFTGFVETTLIRNEENKGFPAAVNQGIRAAKGEVIVLLNNDVIVTPGALDRLASWLESPQIEATEIGDEMPSYVPGAPSFDIVGPMTNYCAGIQQTALSFYEDRDGLNREAAEFAEENAGASTALNFIIGFCMVFKKAVFDAVGDFDESLWPCSGEEIDFCLRARAAGHTVGVAHDVYVHHYGSKTLGDMHQAGTIDYAKLCERNDKHLAEKWGADFWQRQAIEEAKAIPKGLCLNLGCGYRREEGFVNIDNRAEVKPDMVCDILQGLPYDDNSVDMVRADDFLEHIPIGKTVQVITEIWRVLKPGGTFESCTPDAENGQGAFQDPNHVSFWVENSWLYFSDPATRALYGTVADFEIESIRRIETGNRVFHLHVIAKARKD